MCHTLCKIIKRVACEMMSDLQTKAAALNDFVTNITKQLINRKKGLQGLANNIQAPEAPTSAIHVPNQPHKDGTTTNP